MLRMWILEAVTTRIFADVPASAARAYFAVWSRPLGSIRMHSDQVPVPRETLRRSVRVLVEAGWVYPMHVDGKDVIVPWMPVDVEASISARLMSVREDIKHYGEWCSVACWI